MPNWCSNYLSVEGSEAEVLKFTKDVEMPGKTLLSFEKHMPSPPALEHENPDYMTNEMHEWRLNNWGTKWDVVDVDRDISTDDAGSVDATYRFDTAWTPCDKWLKYVASLYALKFRLEYNEEGCGFRGRLVINNGKITKDQYIEFYS